MHGMRASDDQPPLISLIGDLADRQHGVVSWRQLVDAGFDRGVITRLAAKGWLRRVHQGVYAVGRGELTPDGRCMAAVLAHGASAVISHQSAAGLWGLVEKRPGVVDVTVALRAGRRGRDTITVHRSTNLTALDTTTRRRVPVTRPARTLIDCAEHAPRRKIERLLDSAQRLGLFDAAQYRAAIERHPGRQGAARLTKVLDDHDAGSTATANAFEELFIDICDAHNLPRPQTNQRLNAIKPDFRWPDARLIVETDGWATHGTRRAFEADRERDVELTTEGWRVLRFTWHHLTRRPHWVAAKVRQALSP